MRILLMTAMVSFVLAGFVSTGLPSARAGDVDEVKDKVEETAKDVKDKAKDVYEGTRETAESFWEQVPPWAVIPGALLLGLIVGFATGRMTGGKGKDKNKKKK